MIRCKRIMSKWIIFSALSIGAIFFCHYFFKKAFPFVNLTLTVNRSQALQDADKIALSQNLGPSKHKSVAYFSTDHQVKAYVELQAGGKKAFNEMIKGSLYSPYLWKVRCFKPLSAHEVTIAFKPDGSVYEFSETIAQEEQRTTMAQDDAEKLALQTAQSQWHVDTHNFKKVSSSKEVRPNGRIDHTFIYERADVKIGKAPYRMRLVVSGDKFTKLTHYIEVPEEFTHYYQEMLSANNTISTAALITYLLLYILLIGLIGAIYLARRNYVIWKQPITIGLIIATISLAAGISTFPLKWLAYQTTMSTSVFVWSNIVTLIMGFFITSAFLIVVFAIAEGLTRAAFGNQPMLWKSWSRSAACSCQIVGRTLGGYLIVPLLLAWAILFYMITQCYFGWWIPAETLSNPNILAGYFPWLQALAPSLIAGFSEECIFRAFPLATAALLGIHYGKKNWWITFFFVLQILIFGAAHAHYITQPAYARIVELIMFSSLAGYIYLKFGLLTCIACHTLYDFFWFSLPIFVSCAPYAWVNKIIILIIALVPLIIILIRRLQAGHFHELETSDYNQSFIPEKQPEKNIQKQITEDTFRVAPKKTVYLLFSMAIVGLVSFIMFNRWSTDGMPLKISRDQAKELSKKEIGKRGGTLDQDWQGFVNIDNYPAIINNPEHLFIWRTYGPEVYKKLLGTYLTPASWQVKWLRMQGTIIQRAEQYWVSVCPTGAINKFTHIIPENNEGQSLTQEQAREKARIFVQEFFNPTMSQLVETSAQSHKKPHRTDWEFSFSDKAQYPFEKGRALIDISLSGDQLAGYSRRIEAPEQWVRDLEGQRSPFNLINLVCLILLVALLLLAFILLANTYLKSISLRSHFYLAGALFLLFLLSYINNLPVTLATLINAQEPFSNQLLRLIGINALSLIFSTGAFFAALSSINRYLKKPQSITSLLLLGIALAISWSGFMALLNNYVATSIPLWASYQLCANYSPILAIAIGLAISTIKNIIIFVPLIFLINRITKSQSSCLWPSLLIFLIGILVVGCQPIQNYTQFFMCAIFAGLFFEWAYWYIVRFNPTIVIITFATTSILEAIAIIIRNLYPQAAPAGIMACIAVSGLAVLWITKLPKETN